MIVNLSLLLLSKIVSYLDNIDKICLSLVCKRWIPFIKSLQDLSTLTLARRDDSIVSIDLSVLPDSLTSLSIYTSCLLISSLPPSIRHLNIYQTQYDIDEIFKDRSQYHFETLCVVLSSLYLVSHTIWFGSSFFDSKAIGLTFCSSTAPMVQLEFKPAAIQQQHDINSLAYLSHVSSVICVLLFRLIPNKWFNCFQSNFS
ncbi:hypothetical protein PPL_03210 [Heterostelium album PN500]|uniref:F-box domain-containing protein n=1 Tax=Heterostelium pallidum (strain ATCC 26659 / Pp 5 / PN500) TaxID=670386 RepID=D3B488_HETP5|nr:hypothetical protein PPL_03210 [Heterostelium album PN500]EFA84136.1 hypothetical protein PPL_03210 [Heterostelium album PN500]|eukprot:XP_020436253.1 hypothetical protein PPL_03210 [Heterostelium album PN500]